jgi:hypothetical protein
MQQRNLGSQGLDVSELGLGCMGMSEYYGTADEEESVATLLRALDLGVTFLDTAADYRLGHNERLVGQAIHTRRDAVVIATKFGVERDGTRLTVNGRPEYVRKACDESLKRLGVEHIDLYYPSTAWTPTPLSRRRGRNEAARGCGRSATSVSPRPCRRPSGRPTRPIPSRPCRPTIPCGVGTWRTRYCRRRGSSASASCRTVRSGGGF